MFGISQRMTAEKRLFSHHRSTRATIRCEGLEERQLLSGGMGYDVHRHGGHHSVTAEVGSFAGGGQGAMFGGGSLGLGGGIKNPVFLLTASLLNDGSGSSTPSSQGVLSSSAVKTAFQTLESDFSSDVSVGAQPTHASVGKLQDDLGSIRKGTLTGSAATTAIQNDEAAILASLGLSSTQVSQIQSDLQAIQTAIQSTSSSSSSATTPSSSSPSSPNSTASPGNWTPPTWSGSTTTGSSTPSAVQTAFQTLQTDLKSANPNGTQPTQASIGQVQDDLTAIAKGTLTGSQAVTQVQTDTAAVLSSEGLTATQITQIQSDQAAIQSAIQTNMSQPSSAGSTSTSSSSSSTSIASAASSSISDAERAAPKGNFSFSTTARRFCRI